jgi:hypothetical protein
LPLGVAAILELDDGDAVMLVPGDHVLVDGAALVGGPNFGHLLVVFEGF